MKILCRVRIHQWRVSRIESIRYGVIRTLLCRRCGTSHKRAVW